MDGTASLHFSQSYAQARDKFLMAASAAGLSVRSHLMPIRGHDGEDLAMDVALEGPADASSLLVISSACHGVEGFCGSGVQNALLRDTGWHDTLRDSGVAVLYIHALNPYGFSHWRRVTPENVDLNRNFHRFDQPLPANPGYDALADALVPAQWPPEPAAQARLEAYTQEHGLRGLQAAASGGQYRHPDGIFYGGTAPTWSHRTLRRVLQAHGQRCQQLGWIDLHTGLGPSGHGELIFAGRDDAQAAARARQWWGPQVTSIYDGSSSSARLEGLMWNAAYEECPQAVYTGIALEYGTVPVMDVMTALRGDAWLHQDLQRGAEQRAAIRRQVRDAFYTDTDTWKAQIVEQGLAAARAAIKGLQG
ncbi:MAG: M14 family metallopeptidase [Rubrivivax sp.]|jgi:hypothetical protein|nr:M14 family metallopeptidase [Rubrivivax sp.]